ncbi:MAG TPA: ABC transporter substrate-binding protein, partial [Gammaproteobacteria bacterium]|nr:ABC transporter substrate-binding protein [Gammaproteobacteria bacterium]
MRVWYSIVASLVLAAGAAHAADVPKPTAPPPPEAKAEDPSKLVESVANAMLQDLDKDRAAYKQDPSKVNALVEKHLLPVFDTQYSARLVLGKHWREATPEQRERFVNAFYQSLLKNYGSALAEFTSDRMKVLPSQVDSKADNATVRTEIKRNNGDKVSVNYTLHKTPEGWKAWDVVIDGISYVKSFREDFGAEIDQKGL